MATARRSAGGHRRHAAGGRAHELDRFRDGGPFPGVLRLKETALVTARRRGRMVPNQRTTAATALLAAIRSDKATG